MPFVIRSEYDRLVWSDSQHVKLQERLFVIRKQEEFLQARIRVLEDEVADLKHVLRREATRLDSVLLDAECIEKSVMRKLLIEERAAKHVRLKK